MVMIVNFTLEQTTKNKWRSSVIYLRFSTLCLTSAVDGGGWSPHVAATLPPGKGPGTHRTGGRVDPRAGLDGCRKYRPVMIVIIIIIIIIIIMA
jgi:hypothetical protein